MRSRHVDRRTFLAATAAAGAVNLLPGRASAQGAAPALPARGEFVIRGAHVLTMDTGLGDLPSGDVHVRDGAIVAVGPNLAAPNAQTIEGSGTICMPGFVDTHWHLWTSALRPVMRQDNAALGYFPVTVRLGVHYQPQDSYRNVRFGIAEALGAGVTTVQNWAHNVRSPAHADAEMRAMRDTGIRGRFAYGCGQGIPNDQPMDIADLARAQKDWQTGDGMLTLGICSRNVGADPNPQRGNVTIDMAKKEWGGARALGMPITLHTSGPRVTQLLEDAGLLGPDVQFVHPLNTTAEDRAILAKRGTSYSIAATAEARRPLAAGVIQLAELLEAGVKVSLSTDHNTTYNCDVFVAMRILYSLHQHRVGSRYPITTRRLVELATIDGARDLGMADRIGSLAPGKRADLILVRTTDMNMSPIGDPYDALVALAQPGNVDTVVVDGRILRRNNRFTALDYPQVLRDAVQSGEDLRARAMWP